MFKSEQKACTSDENQEDGQQSEKTLKEDKRYEEIMKQLEELTKQLNFKVMYETEQKRCSKVEDQFREQCKLHADILKQLLDNETSKQKELWSIESIQRLFKELKCESCTKNEDAHKKEILDKGNVIDEEILKLKVLTENLKEEIIQLKNQLTAYEKQWESQANFYKESEEAHKKEFHKLELKLEEFKREEDEKFKDCKELYRKEIIYSLQLKIEELEREKVKKSEGSEVVQQKKETKSTNASFPQLSCSRRQTETQLQVNEEIKKKCKKIQPDGKTYNWLAMCNTIYFYDW